MNDGKIAPAAPVPVQPVKSVEEPPLVKIIALPPDMPPEMFVDKILQGEIIANKDGQVTVKTPQGQVTLEADIPFPIGEKVEIKIQNILQNNISTNAVILQPASTTDRIVIPSSQPLQEFAPLQANLVALPEMPDAETLPLLIKSLSQLPVNNPLPPSLAEGLAKFQQLIGLLAQANLMPGLSFSPPGPQNMTPQNIIPTLQQLLQKPESGPLFANPAQNFIQLQTILPGEKIAPDILLSIRQQLLTVLQNTSAVNTVPVAEDNPLLLQSIQNLIGNFLHPETPGAIAAPENAKPLFTMPAIGLVLTLPSALNTEVKTQNLVLVATPQAQQLIGLLSLPQAQKTEMPLLPGTILVMAFKPQAEKNMTLPLLATDAMQGAQEIPSPLHPKLGEDWPALDALWGEATLQEAAQPEVLAGLKQTLPSPAPQQMPPAFLFFLSILKHDVLPHWLNEKQLEKLQKIDKSALLKQVAEDLQAIRARNDDTLPADSWRPLPMPLQVGDQLLRLQWFYRHPQDDAPESSGEEQTPQKKKKTRFLLDVPKTRLGDIQIDGLVAEKNLEIILRTEMPMMSHSEAIIRTRLGRVLETTGMQGGINFQSGRGHYVRV